MKLSNTARVELKLHTTMSESTSVITSEIAVKEAVSHGLKAIAVADLNSVQSFHELARCREKYGKNLKIIYGAELLNATVLVKNQKGLKPLYKLVSGKDITPQEREHLLFGANCCGPLHKAACNGADIEMLHHLAADYDYIELGIINDLPWDRDMNLRLYDLGKKLGKPVAAVGNCHYIHPREKVCTSVLDTLKGNCAKTEELYLRTTEEMLEQFAYLGEEAAFEVVITNPNQIADEIEQIDPRKIDAPLFDIPGADAEVRRNCEERLHALYGEQPEISKRLEHELMRLGKNASLFLLCHKLVKHLREKNALYGLRGTLGSTMIAYLLDISDTNPLPAHYRCPACKHTEFAEADSGYDLPKKNCPCCGKPMVSDGQNIPFETCMGVDGEFRADIELNVSDDMRPEAVQFLADLLGRERLAAGGTVNTYNHQSADGCLKAYADMTGEQLPCADREWIADMIRNVKSSDGIQPGGVLLLPEGMEWEDVTPMRSVGGDGCEFVTQLEYYHIAEAIPKVGILSSDYYGRLQKMLALTGAALEDIDYNDPKVYALFQDSDTGGIPEFDGKYTQRLLGKLNTISFSDLIKVSGLAHSTYSRHENTEDLMQEHSFRELIGNRDDVFLTLRKYGVDIETAYTAMTATRKGKLHSNWRKNEAMLEGLQQAGVPEWYLEAMQNIGYLSSKANVVHCVKLAYMAAWFKVYCPETFCKVTPEATDTAEYETVSDEELQKLRMPDK